MPYVPRFKPADLQRVLEKMKQVPVSEIDRRYRTGEITLATKIEVLSLYGDAEREAAMLGAQAESQAKTSQVGKSGGGLTGPIVGEAKFYAQNVMNEFKASWDAANAEGGAKKSEAVLHGLMGSLKALDALNIPGDVVERWALEIFPESPGFARLANWAMWIPTNFFGISTLLKAPFKAAEVAAKAGIKAGAKLADELAFIKDPVGHAIRQSQALEAATATKLAKASAENVTRKGQGVASAAAEAEGIKGTQVFRGDRAGQPFDPAKVTDKGVSVTTSRDYAETFGTPENFNLLPSTKMLEYDQIPPNIAKLPEFRIVEYARAQGFDAVEVAKKTAPLNIDDIRIINPDVLAPGVTGGKQAFKTAEPAPLTGPTQAAMPIEQMATPQDLEAMTVTQLIKHYTERSEKTIRSSTEPFKYKGVSHAETKAAASAKPLSFDEIIARGPDAPISATELEAIGRVHEKIADAFNSVVDDAAQHLGDIRSGARPDLVESYKAHLAAMELTNPAFLSGRGQAGRGLEYLTTMQDLVRESLTFDTITRALGAEKFLNGSNEAMAYTIQKVANLSKNSRARLLEEAGKSTAEASTLRLFYKSLLFANPGTHVANMVGNTSSILLNGVNKTASSLIPGSSVTMREAAANWSGMFEARHKLFEIHRNAVENAGKSLEKAGIEGTATGSMVKYGPLGWLGYEDEFMAGVVNNGLAKGRATVEVLSKWDEMQDAVRAGAFTMPAGTQKRKWTADYVDSAMNNPENYKRLVADVEQESDKILFRSPLSRAGELIARGIRQGPLDYYLPVIKFPINAMKMARDWTPGFNMISKEFVEALAEGGAKEAAARSRMTLSWMMASQIYEAAKMGYITGGGPTDPKAQDAWRKAGNTPYAIHGVPIRWFEPVGSIVGFISDLAHVSGEMDMDKLEGATSTLMFSMYRFVENNYWLRLMEGLTNAVSDVKNIGDFQDNLHAIAKVAMLPLKNLSIGGSPIGRRVGEMMDPKAPDTRSYGELEDLKTYFFAGTPFGAGGRPRLNYSGKPHFIPPILGTEWVKENLGAPDWLARGIGFFTPPMRQNQPSEDPVAEFMTKHELTLHNNWKHYGGTSDPDSPVEIMKGKPRVNLNGDEAYDWEFLAKNHARQYGTSRTWNEAIAALDAEPEFNKLPRPEKQKELNQLYIEFRETAKDEMRKVNPEIQRKEAERDALEASGQPNPGIIPGIERVIFGAEQPQTGLPEGQPTEQRPVEVQPLPTEAIGP